VDSIAARDRQDSARKTSPLVIPLDAVVIDSSEMTLDAVVAAALGSLADLGLARARGVL
jgi:cytidylate kinase